MTHQSDPQCRALLAGISAYLDGELGAAECETIERHCRECPDCARLVRGFRQTVGLCREAGAEPLPEPVRRLAQESIRRLLEG
jgi:anti-sigma factor RsiW